ncbi:hypothetical protein [Spirosoma sp. KNUC1025]|uniref:hypothetical protein n=1 Tax=Spirosoma sp. KNUC1025 TaxID=2894082 RepID=UPI00386E2AF4|nr:hypothetical protein LN737_00660 [Spirosoma sp. KNUC1025]
MTAAIFASVAKIKALTSAGTQLRKGGRLRGASHEFGGIRGTSAFADIEVEGGEHVTNAQASERYDKTLTALNQNNANEAIRALMKEGGIGFPSLIIQHMKEPGFGNLSVGMDLSSLTSELREHKELTRLMLNQLKIQGSKKQITAIGSGIIIEQEDGRTSYRDLKGELKQKGFKVD